MSAPDELLDWTIGPAPPPDAQPATSARWQAPSATPAPERAAPPRPRGVSRRAWLVLLGLPVILVLLLTLALPQLESWRTRRAVEQVVAQQEQARLAADWPALRATYADPSGSAAQQVLRLRSGWFPWPIGLAGLQSAGQPVRLAQFQVLGPQLVRADVVRTYVLADGTHASFALPQYYQFVPTPPAAPAAAPIWRQMAPPAVDQLQRRQISGTRVDVVYYPADAEFALSLAHDLDSLLVRACLDWDCPAGVRVRVRFNADEPPGSARAGAYDSLFGSLTFQAVFAHRGAGAWREISLPTRLVYGYPAGAPAVEAVRRAAGVQALLIVAQQMAPRTAALGGTAFLDALVVREGVRLGLEPARLAQVKIANPLFDANKLWLLPDFDLTTDVALPQALALLNQLLAGRALADERQLLRVLGQGAADTQSWLASGLGLTPADVEQRLNAALDPRFPPVQRPGFVPDLALSCPAGPLLASLAGQTAPLLAGDYPDSVAYSWSPDGNRLALSVSGRLGIANYSEAAGQFVPQAALPDRLLQAAAPPLAWASPGVLVYTPAYVTLPGPGQPALVSSSGPTFFDVITRARTGIPDYDSYWPSSDRRWAVIGAAQFGGSQDLAIIPGLGGPGQRIGAGSHPAWSPDSQSLVFARSIQGQLSLVRYDVASGLDRVLAYFGDSGVPVATAGNGGDILIPAWSPSGDELAVAVTTASGDLFDGWVGLLAADGSGLHMLAPAQNGMQPFGPSFSADGRYLAVGLYDGTPRSGVALYSAAGSLLGWYPGLRSAGWSPAGHILALAGLDGISLLRDPAAVPQPLGPPGCSGVAWR